MDQKKLMEKVNKMKGSDLMDLASKEDLAIGIMNLISLEEHFFFTYHKTGNSDYLKLLNEIRALRKKHLAKIVQNPKGEVWCISKHLLAASMRFMEVGTKKLGEGKNKEAEDLFNDAYSLWNLFWGLNLDLLDITDIDAKKIDESKISAISDDKEDEDDKEDDKFKSIFSKLGKVVNKLLDCCRE